MASDYIFGSLPPQFVSSTVQTVAPLIVGKYYYINTFVAGDDFSNVDTVITGTGNTTGCVFLCTGTTPTNWTHGSSLSRVLLLNNFVTSTEDREERETINESELIADREIIDRGEFLIFEGRLNLFKYGTAAQIKAKFTELYAYHKTNVYLWKHQDGAPFVGVDGTTPVLFYLEIFPKNLYTLDLRDILIMRFRSLKAVKYVAIA